jgi:tetrahydromethanopterin S-methyltransferase subunit F
MHMAMEYTDTLMEMYIMENTKTIKRMVKDIRGGQMAMNIGENSRMACNGEREY